MRGAKNSVLSLEEMTEEELEQLKAHYYELAERAQAGHNREPKKRTPKVRKGAS